MKLLYILGSYYPAQSGGPNNSIHWQAKYLSKEGVDVSVASLKTGLSQRDVNNYNIQLNLKSKVEGVKAYYFDYFLNRYLSFKFYIWLILNISKFDFVQLTSYFFPVTWFAALICNITKTPFSIAPRGELEDNAIKFNRLIKIILHKIFLKFLYRRAKFIMITSIQELEFSKKYFNENMPFELIPNYIELSKTGELSEVDLLKKKNILYLGRLHPKKGIANLIKAYFSLDESIINSHLLLITGTGELDYVNSLKALVDSSKYNERVIFLGHKQGIEKEKIYKQSKVLVLPSYSENFGNVVLESLSFSTPVIASKYTPWEVLEVNKCGLWIDNTPDKIMKGMTEILMMKKSDYMIYSMNSYKYVKKEFDIHDKIHDVIRVYKKYMLSINKEGE
jgi:glycosyltransferase involved in cell wall biosynthesis